MYNKRDIEDDVRNRNRRWMAKMGSASEYYAIVEYHLVKGKSASYASRF